MTDFPPEALLEAYPPPIVELADRLRTIMRRAVPDAVERVRPGWRLIGYDLPIGRRTTFFAFITPESRHVHIGFALGMLMADPDRLLIGRGSTKRARWLTFEPGDRIDRAPVERLIREALRVSRMGPEERYVLGLQEA